MAKGSKSSKEKKPPTEEWDENKPIIREFLGVNPRLSPKHPEEDTSGTSGGGGGGGGGGNH